MNIPKKLRETFRGYINTFSVLLHRFITIKLLTLHFINKVLKEFYRWLIIKRYTFYLPVDNVRIKFYLILITS